MEICIVAINYPTEKRHIHIFLDNVVQKFVDRGIRCHVIAPQSSFSYYARPRLRREFISYRKTEQGNAYCVYSPLYTVFPNARLLADQSKYSFYRAIRTVYEEQKLQPDFIYAHFLQAGIPAVMLAQAKGIPAFIANGEADTLASVRHISPSMIKKALRGAAGIISVSQKCRDEISRLCDGDQSVMEKVTVIPNAVNQKRFYPMDRAECRRKIGIPEDAFVAAFTGSFIARKGVMKVAAAVNALEGVYGIFIGTGQEKPACDKALFCGTLENEKIAEYLNAADVFVLPTLAEGCSNAIVEAIACGLPIISSNLPFNWDILDDSCAILIDPEDQEQITQAVKTLRDDCEERERLGAGSRQKAETLSLDRRIDRILGFLTQHANGCESSN